MMRVQNYSQFDPRWADVVMAPSSLKMRGWGCMVTSLSMALGNYAIEINPGDLCRKISEFKGFDSLGYFDNTVIPKMFPSVLNYARENTTNIPGGRLQPSAAIEKIRSLVSAGQPVLIWVDNVKQDGEADHWVLVKDHKNVDFLINNPDGGLEQWFSVRYGDPLKKIYGFLALVGPPIEFPDHSTISDKKRGQAMFKAAQVAQGKNVQVYSKEILNDLV